MEDTEQEAKSRRRQHENQTLHHRVGPQLPASTEELFMCLSGAFEQREIVAFTNTCCYY